MKKDSGTIAGLLVHPGCSFQLFPMRKNLMSAGVWGRRRRVVLHPSIEGGVGAVRGAQVQAFGVFFDGECRLAAEARADGELGGVALAPGGQVALGPAAAGE